MRQASDRRSPDAIAITFLCLVKNHQRIEKKIYRREQFFFFKECVSVEIRRRRLLPLIVKIAHSEAGHGLATK